MSIVLKKKKQLKKWTHMLIQKPGFGSRKSFVLRPVSKRIGTMTRFAYQFGRRVLFVPLEPIVLEFRRVHGLGRIGLEKPDVLNF